MPAFVFILVYVTAFGFVFVFAFVLAFVVEFVLALLVVFWSDLSDNCGCVLASGNEY